MSNLKIYGKKFQEGNSKLSISKNLKPKQVQLQLNKNNLKLESSTKNLKQKLEISVLSDGRKFISRAAAFALGLIQVRAIIVYSNNNLFEITNNQIENIKNTKKNIEIIYKNIEYVKDSIEKQRINVYIDQNNNRFISNAAAYAIGLLDAVLIMDIIK